MNFSTQELAKLEQVNRKAQRISEMVNLLVLFRDETGVLRDSEGHVRNVQGQKLDADGNAILEVVEHVDRQAAGHVGRHRHNVGGSQHGYNGNEVEERALAEFNRPSQFYANRSAIRPPAFQRNDFELKPAYYTLVGQHPFHGPRDD